MMAATRSTKRRTERLPEDQVISKTKSVEKQKRNWRERDSAPVLNIPRDEEMEPSTEEGELSPVKQAKGAEIPYAEVLPLPTVTRVQRKEYKEDERDERQEDGDRSPEVGFENRASLQSDERARSLIKEALKNPISITTEDLLNVSEPARQELRRLLTKKRLEKKSVTFASEVSEKAKDLQDCEEVVIHAEKLPDVSYEILKEDTKGVPKGALVIGDPVLQYLSTLQPGERPKKVVVARESQGLRAVYPLINGVGEVESLLDGGSQIVSMAKDVAEDLEVSWDPDITVHMQSANRSLEQTLGLAKNVPFLFGNITVYLQVHVMEEPAYKVLLGRPFDTVTESLIKNEKDGNQSLTLTDPNSGERCVMRTHERGKPPNVLKRPITQDFRMASMS
jgi:hypothetical protein